ncbi:hypothetical protein F0U61_44815 [Archangium violaceum]|uniref:extracellular catalytic domain type 1 short-chain-length polyhydroxyalkanoate depolymerase n=1 Tax=Archangium violaceum TaxID=83451 RepID=UPI002B2D84F3|nr:hypothetical protein F0U61_44815 [Archangium violaceum]
MSTRPFSLNALSAATLLFTVAACSDSEPETTPPPQAPNYGPPSAPAPTPLPERTSCTGLTVGAGTYDWTLTHQGRTRLYRVFVPTGYNPTRPTPAVFSFHGFGSNEQEQEGLSRMSEQANAQGFIAVYPRGLNQTELTGATDPRYEDTRSWNAGVCCGPAQISRVDDVSFVDAILAELDTRVCLDTKRIYATGLSNGGFFSYRLACERAGQFAAIAPVAGMEGYSPCEPVRPVSVMHFHGTDDQTILYEGGDNILFGGPYPSARDSVERWARRNLCTGSTVNTYAQGDSSCETYDTCGQNTSVTLCTVQGGGHTWPGGLVPPHLGYTTQDLDATRELWRFFFDHPRP